MAGTGIDAASQGAQARLGIVVVSTRPGRVGPSVGRWMERRARVHGGFAVDVIDLAEIALPLLDEPDHPRLGRYRHAHTRAWSARVEAQDAFVFVAPEYNHGMAAPLKNALDYLHTEWQYRPAGFASYGGVAAGTRGVQMAKEVLIALKVMPLPEAVHIPFIRQFLDEKGELVPNETMDQAANAMLDELARWEKALRALRRPGQAGAAGQGR